MQDQISQLKFDLSARVEQLRSKLQKPAKDEVVEARVMIKVRQLLDG